MKYCLPFFILMLILAVNISTVAATDIKNGPSTKSSLIFYTGADTPLKDILEVRLKEACRRNHIKCVLEHTGLAQRALTLANEQGDGDALRIKTVKQVVPHQTSNLILIPESIINIKFYVYSKKKLTISGWQSLKPYHNSFRTGVKILEQNLSRNITVLPNTERLLQMLNAGRVDTVIEQELIADYQITKLKFNNLYKSTKAIYTSKGYALLHKKHRDLIPLIAKSLLDMKNEGTFDKLKASTLNHLLRNNSLER